MSLAVAVLALYLAWHWLRAIEQRRSAERAATPYVERYRPPRIVYGAERPDAPVYPAGHAPRRAWTDYAGAQEVFLCSCGASVAVTRHESAMASKPLRAIERAFALHAADFEACAAAANGKRV